MNWNDVFDYKDGKLYWAIKPSVAVAIGDEAGHINESGYSRFRYKSKNYLAHRVIWEMHNGDIPDEMEINHINHDKIDNRINNLRCVEKLCNMWNLPKSARNKSGVVGVRFNERRGFWEADIRVKGKLHHLGFFATISEAIKAREQAVIYFGFHENHGGRNE